MQDDQSRAVEFNANSQFFDDSSAALGLGYGATAIRSGHPDDREVVPALTADERALRDQEQAEAAKRAQDLWRPLHAEECASASQRPDVERAPDGTVVPFNAGAYGRWKARTRELVDAGYPRAQAEAIARNEIQPDAEAETGVKVTGEIQLGASVESLMARRVDVHGGSHSGRKFGEPKRGSKMCRKCGLERKVCGCYSGRGEKITACVTDQTKNAINQQDVSAGQILEAVMEAAIAGGRTVRAVLRLLKRLDKALVLRDPGCATCATLPENQVCPNCALQWQTARGIA